MIKQSYEIQKQRGTGTERQNRDSDKAELRGNIEATKTEGQSNTRAKEPSGREAAIKRTNGTEGQRNKRGAQGQKQGSGKTRQRGRETEGLSSTGAEEPSGREAEEQRGWV